MNAVSIATLSPGQRFRLFDDFVEEPDSDPDTFLTRVRGTVLSIGAGSACVKLDSLGPRDTVVTDKLTGLKKTVSIPRPAKVENWSLGTTVVLLSAPAPKENDNEQEILLDSETEIS